MHHTASRAPPGRRVADDEPIRGSSGDSSPRTQSAKRPYLQLQDASVYFSRVVTCGGVSVGAADQLSPPPTTICWSWRTQISARSYSFLSPRRTLANGIIAASPFRRLR